MGRAQKKKYEVKNRIGRKAVVSLCKTFSVDCLRCGFFRSFICPIEDNTFSSYINLGLLIFIKEVCFILNKYKIQRKILSSHIEEFTFHLTNFIYC